MIEFAVLWLLRLLIKLTCGRYQPESDTDILDELHEG